MKMIFSSKHFLHPFRVLPAFSSLPEVFAALRPPATFWQASGLWIGGARMKKYFRELSVAFALGVLLLALAVFAPSFYQAATAALAGHA